MISEAVIEVSLWLRLYLRAVTLGTHFKSVDSSRHVLFCASKYSYGVVSSWWHKARPIDTDHLQPRM